jgi:hypothetical protein
MLLSFLGRSIASFKAEVWRLGVCGFQNSAESDGNGPHREAKIRIRFDYSPRGIWETAMTKSTRPLLAALITALLLTAGGTCYAQFTGSVQGTVLDTTGAVIPKATVKLLNTNTQVAQQATSDSAGVYSFVSLAPGPYSVTASASGFGSATTTFTLTTNENRNVPLTLTVGQVSTNVTVTTEAPLIDTSDSRLEQTLNTTALTDLPLPGRNPTNVITVAPGVTGLGGQASPGTANSTNFAPENWVNASANGRGANGNQYVVDGMDVTSSIRPGVINLTPNADTVQEPRNPEPMKFMGLRVSTILTRA